MPELRAGVVIPVGPGRQENAQLAVAFLLAADVSPERIVLVCDGPDARMPNEYARSERVRTITLQFKHQPGMEQPRNTGAKYLAGRFPELNAVWFLDSDVLVYGGAFDVYQEAWVEQGPAIMFGPYLEYPMQPSEFGPNGNQHPVGFRTAMFQEHDRELSAGGMGHALACFAGNLVWPLSWFLGIGGFWNELSMGRVEDGELGLRAARNRLPMLPVAAARGWHREHPRDMMWIEATNAREVPLLHARHGKAEEYKGSLVPVAEDGMRFDWVCPACGLQMNSGVIWEHVCLRP